MSAPRKSTATGTIYWSNGDLFDGWLLIGVVPPQSGGTNWPTVKPSDMCPHRAPSFYMIRIKLKARDEYEGFLYE
jgi:hypothetical protein